jgi:eukaryotic-like serine/threonine-protein kinase
VRQVDDGRRAQSGARRDRTEEMGGPLSANRVLDDRYELLELVGAGGMAEVWRATDRRLGRDVAVKLLAGPAARDASRRRKIAREAKALATANHPNIVAVYDYGEAPTADDDVMPYIVMELVDGPDLGQHLAARGPLPVDEAREIMRGILAAVERAHVSGVVHGDLKPANVFIGSHGPKVGDFGVARILGEETGTTTVAATPTFAAPEVLRGERASAASDVYSAACITYEMLTGRPPYEGANAWEVAQKHVEEPPPRVRRARSDVPSDLDAAIHRGMEKLPRRRFPSATAFADAIGVHIAAAEAAPAVVSDDLTVPVTAATPARPDSTEVIAGAPRDDPARAALLGPLAGIGSWFAARRARGRGERRVAPSAPLIAGLVAVVALLVLGSVLLLDRGPASIPIPDVTGELLTDASSSLRERGFTVDVSYQPVTEGEAGRVLETIPSADELVTPGSNVHLVASAFASTPQPVVTKSPVDDDDRPRGRGKRKRDKDDD